MLAILLASTLATAPLPSCSVARLDVCRDTNQLVWTPSFQAALKRFFGAARGSYLENDHLVYDQALEAIGGPPDNPKTLPDGLRLLTACQGHDCPVKGGVVMDGQGRILAFGLLNFHCHKVPQGQSPCDRSPTLDMFVQRFGPETQPWESALLAWAKPAADADQAAMDGDEGPLQGVDMRALANELPAKRR